MKKIYTLIIAIFIGNIANAQNWQSVGPNCINMPSQKGNGSYSMAIDNNGTPPVFVIKILTFCKLHKKRVI